MTGVRRPLPLLRHRLRRPGDGPGGLPRVRLGPARVRSPGRDAHRQRQAVHRLVRQGPGGGSTDLPRQRDQPPDHPAAAPDHDGEGRAVPLSLCRELTDAVPLADLAGEQAAIDDWVRDYNTGRQHQAIGMKTPAERFSTARAMAERELLPLRLPAVISLAPISALPAAEELRQPGSSWAPSRRSPSAGSTSARSSRFTSPPRPSRSTSTTRTTAPSAAPRPSQSAASKPHSPRKGSRVS